MKKIFTLALMVLAITVTVSCSQDETPNDPQTPTGMVGHQFDLVIGNAITINNQYASIETYIKNPANGAFLFHNGFPQYVIPDVYWVAPQVYQSPAVADQAVIVKNSTMRIRLVDVPQSVDILLYQHVPPIIAGDDPTNYNSEQFVNTVTAYSADHPRKAYTIDTHQLQPSDALEFTVGEGAAIESYSVIRNNATVLTAAMPQG